MISVVVVVVVVINTASFYDFASSTFYFLSKVVIVVSSLRRWTFCCFAYEVVPLKLFLLFNSSDVGLTNAAFSDGRLTVVLFLRCRDGDLSIVIFPRWWSALFAVAANWAIGNEEQAESYYRVVKDFPAALQVQWVSTFTLVTSNRQTGKQTDRHYGQGKTILPQQGL